MATFQSRHYYPKTSPTSKGLDLSTGQRNVEAPKITIEFNTNSDSKSNELFSDEKGDYWERVIDPMIPNAIGYSNLK